MSPSRPTTTDETMSPGVSTSISSGTVRMVTSTVTEPISDLLRSGKRGSWQADLAASSMALPTWKYGIGNPMHPRRS